MTHSSIQTFVEMTFHAERIHLMYAVLALRSHKYDRHPMDKDLKPNDDSVAPNQSEHMATLD